MRRYHFWKPLLTGRPPAICFSGCCRSATLNKCRDPTLPNPSWQGDPSRFFVLRDCSATLNKCGDPTLENVFCFVSSFLALFLALEPVLFGPFRADRWSEIIVPETAVTRTSRHCLRACPLSFAFLRFSCFFATKSHQNCMGRAKTSKNG